MSFMTERDMVGSGVTDYGNIGVMAISQPPTSSLVKNYGIYHPRFFSLLLFFFFVIQWYRIDIMMQDSVLLTVTTQRLYLQVITLLCWMILRYYRSPVLFFCFCLFLFIQALNLYYLF